MQKWKKTFMIVAVVCGVTGCGLTEKSPSMDTVSVQKDGTIKQTIVDQFDQNDYDAEELSAMAQEKINRYSDGAGNIVCDSVEENNGQIVVMMTYQTGADYTDFNNRELFTGTVAEAMAEGYSLQDVVSNNGTSLSESEVTAAGENHIVIVQTKEGEKLDVNVYNKILYTSDNVTLSGKKDAIIDAQEDMISYIIFQK